MERIRARDVHRRRQLRVVLSEGPGCEVEGDSARRHVPHCNFIIYILHSSPFPGLYLLSVTFKIVTDIVSDKKVYPPYPVEMIT